MVPRLKFPVDFHLHFLPDQLAKENHKYIIQEINNHLKIVYWKARDLDEIAPKSQEKIFSRIKRIGEEFTDMALLDPDIESALLAGKTNTKIEAQKKNFLKLANKFFESCYEISKFF